MNQNNLKIKKIKSFLWGYNGHVKGHRGEFGSQHQPKPEILKREFAPFDGSVSLEDQGYIRKPPGGGQCSTQTGISPAGVLSPTIRSTSQTGREK
jgi:hypothetical protein